MGGLSSQLPLHQFRGVELVVDAGQVGHVACWRPPRCKGAPGDLVSQKRGRGQRASGGGVSARLAAGSSRCARAGRSQAGLCRQLRCRAERRLEAAIGVGLVVDRCGCPQFKGAGAAQVLETRRSAVHGRPSRPRRREIALRRARNREVAQARHRLRPPAVDAPSAGRSSGPNRRPLHRPCPSTDRCAGGSTQVVVWASRTTGGVSSEESSALSSSINAAGMSVSNMRTESWICSSDLQPTTTVCTAGCPSGNWTAAARSGTPWRSQTARMRWARSINSVGAS